MSEFSPEEFEKVRKKSRERQVDILARYLPFTWETNENADLNNLLSQTLPLIPTEAV